MLELFKKTMLAGVGFAAITKEKAEQMAKEFIEKSEMTEKEGKKFVEELLNKSERVRVDMESKINDMIQASLTKMNIATQKDIARLEAQIKRMSAKQTKPPTIKKASKTK